MEQKKEGIKQAVRDKTIYGINRDGFNNIYEEIMNGGGTETNAYGDVYTKIQETATRLANMKKYLLFQPGFFSGSKEDFRQRMRFLETLTKPSKNTQEGNGFSFTNAPVCKMKIGDWIDHLVIFENVDYDYKEGTWTLDTTTGDDAVQPMMVQVTLQFKIIGQYQNYTLLPPLADDSTGWFGIRSDQAAPSVDANTNKDTTDSQGQGQSKTSADSAGGSPAASAAAVSIAGNDGSAPTKDQFASSSA
jgi:hypothetical protein